MEAFHEVSPLMSKTFLMTHFYLYFHIVNNSLLFFLIDYFKSLLIKN